MNTALILNFNFIVCAGSIAALDKLISNVDETKLGELLLTLGVHTQRGLQ